MTASKPLNTTTAIARFLALPVLAGTLVGCGYASRLPDAPSNLGYELADKPPSVTSNGELKRLPPPPISEGAFADLSSPVEYRTGADVVGQQGLKLPVPKNTEAPVNVTVESKGSMEGSHEDVAFAPLEFEAVKSPSARIDTQDFIAPPVQNVAVAAPAPTYSAPAYSVPSAPVAPIETVAAPMPAPVQSITYESAPIQYETVQSEPLSYGSAHSLPVVDSTIYSQPLETISADSYMISSAPSISVDPLPAPAPVSSSPLSILSARMANGAIINVHPVIGTPGNASSLLARTVLAELGTPVSEDVARSTPAAFDLRGRADRNTQGYVGVEWILLDSSGNTVGTFREHQNGVGWKEMGDDVLTALGRRVADRIARNGELRRATLYAAGSAPSQSYTIAAPQPNRTFILKKGAQLANSPLPVMSPRRRVASQSPYIGPIQTQPLDGSVYTAQRPVSQTPPPHYAPTPRVRAQAPRQLASAPPPSFNTLRAAPGSTVSEAAPIVQSSGPRPLVFRGVSGAPGDGDQSLSREVARLLRDSGANVSANGGPGALFLTAQVSKTPTGSADRIEIVWRVSDAQGNSIGQVTQANDVPRGMLDNNWGEDAYYAAEGARDGIMQLLQSSGALDS